MGKKNHIVIPKSLTPEEVAIRTAFSSSITPAVSRFCFLRKLCWILSGIAARGDVGKKVAFR
jgi:hypothetical protein